MYMTMMMKSLTHSYTHHHEADDYVSVHHTDVGWHFPDLATETFPRFDAQTPCIQYADPQCPKLLEHLLEMDAQDVQGITDKFERRQKAVLKKIH